MNRKFTSAVVWRVASMLSGVLSGMLQIRILPQYMDIERFNVLNGVQTLLIYLPYLDLGYRTAINRRLLVGTSDQHRLLLIRFGQALYLRIAGVLLPAVLLVVALYSLLPNVHRAHLSVGFFLALGFSGTLSMLVSAQINLLVGLGEQRRVFQLNTLASWANLFFVWGALRLQLELWAIPISMCIVAILQGGISWFLCRKTMPGFQLLIGVAPAEFKGLFKDLWPEAVACFRSQIAILLLFNADILLAANLGVGAVASQSGGRYGGAARIFAQVRNLLQAGSEAVWPLIARYQKSDNSQESTAVLTLSKWLLCLNAWLYGGAIGALIMVLGPFAEWWTRNEISSWAPEQALVVLMCLRFLITGVSSPAAYYLIGAGKFGILARGCERELAMGVGLSLIVGPRYHGVGVAASFLAATVCATLTPLFWAWAKSVRLKPGEWYIRIISRALVSCVASATISGWCLQLWGGGWGTIPAAAAGCAVAAMACLAWIYRREPSSDADFLGRFRRLGNL
jgi:O-antigen/teichoic acid export membrane protein